MGRTKSDYCVDVEAGRLVRMRAAFALAAGLLGVLGPNLATTANAAPSKLWDSCNSEQPSGQRCSIPRGIAVQSRSGRLFVADQVNRRVVELNARGEFIKAWGWDVTEGSGTGFEICIPENGDACQQGSIGEGSGQFGFESPQGMAVDSAGNVYAADRGLPSNQRVQKFDADGNFVLMFGGDVNRTKVEEPGSTEAQRNLCTATSGDVCQKGGEGSGKGQFGEWPAIAGDWIDADTKGTPTDADDRIYVGDGKRIQVFDTGGNYLEDVPLDPEGALNDHTVRGLSVDAAGDLYVIYIGLSDVRKIDMPSGKEMTSPRFEVADPTAVAVDQEDNVYTFRPPVVVGQQRHPIFKFDLEGNLIEEFGQSEFDNSTGLATNICPGSQAPGNLYVSNASISNAFVRAYGTEPVGCFKALTLPADPIAETAATLNGTVNPKGEAVEDCFFRWGETTAYGNVAPCVPNAGEIGAGSEPVPVEADLTGLTRGTVYHFRLIAEAGGEAEPGSDLTFKTRGPPVIANEHVFGTTDTEATLRGLANPEGFATTCHFEYTTKAAFEEVGFAGAQSTPEKAIDEERSDRLLSASLKGLEPGTAYRWRIVCTNSSDTTEGANLSFATFFQPSGADPICPNAEFLTGASAFLPDCRAYEMVSPVDKNGGNILLNSEGDIRATPDGGCLTYNTIPAFGDVQNSWVVNQYLACRTESGEPGAGWFNHGIHPPVVGRSVVKQLEVGFGLVRDILAFTPDLCNAWIFDYAEPSLRPDGQEGYADFYRRDNCDPDEGSLEALFPQPPPLPQGTPEDFIEATGVQGVSADGAHAIFLAKAPLLQDCRTTSTAKTIEYQWLRNGTPIVGATSPTYAATGVDVGAVLQCQVFAINENAGSTQAANPPSIIPVKVGEELEPPVAPSVIAPPSPANPIAGTTLTCNPGAWLEADSFAFQWYRNGLAITGATGSTYQVQAADVPGAIQCAVTGANEDGAVTKVSGNRLTSPAPAPLPPGANANVGDNIARIYDRHGGELHLVSILPDGRISSNDSSVGSGPHRSIENAVSKDGSRVYWITGPEVEFGNGRIFLRQHPEQGAVADECTDAAKACTVLVSSGSAFYWTAASDGSKALYSEGGLSDATAELFEFDLNEGGEPQTRTVAGGLEGVVGASDDLSRIYFVSREDLGGGAVAGAPNLYLDEGGVKTLVATLAEDDVTAEQPGLTGGLPYDLVSEEISRRTTRVSADGSRLVFLSRASLTGYDNTDANNGKADIEVFAYEPGGELVCVSCNPSGSRPVGRELVKPHWSAAPAVHGVFAAAWIPAPEHPLHASNLVSSDGDRIFFNSNDALLARDTNGTMDVYQWEVLGKGSCDTSDPSYFPQNGGCLDLISAGESPFESEFWEASESGDNVFFITESSLVGKDPGLVDLYDARIGGGFPEPVKKPICEGEACQSPPPAPAYRTPASANFTGPGDPNPTGKARKRCPKGKRKVRRAGKARCVKRKGKAPKSRRAAR